MKLSLIILFTVITLISCDCLRNDEGLASKDERPSLNGKQQLHCGESRWVPMNESFGLTEVEFLDLERRAKNGEAAASERIADFYFVYALNRAEGEKWLRMASRQGSRTARKHLRSLTE